MNPLDWLLAIVLTYSLVRAALRGFFQEAFALGGLIAGFLFACWFYVAAARQLSGLIASPPIAQMAAFLLILAATMIAATLLGKLLRRTASAIGLGFLDRLLGAAFGLVRGALLCLALLLTITSFLPTGPWIQQSKFVPYFLQAAHAVSFVMPSGLQRRFADGSAEITGRIKHTSPDWIKLRPALHTR